MTVSEYTALERGSPEEAFRALYEEYCDYVYSIVYNRLSVCGTREDIEECVSDVFAEAWQGLDTTLPGSTDLKGYIGTIARRRAINRYHSAALHDSRTTRDEKIFDGMSSASDTEKEYEQTELREVLLRCIESLGEPDRTIIIQKYYYSRSSAQIADKLKMKPSAVRMRAKRAGEKLKELLKNAGFGKE